MQRSHVDSIVVAPWHQLIDAALRPVIDELGECVGQPGMRVHVVEFARLDERGNNGPVGAALIGTGEECILSIQCKWPDGSLDGVGIHLDAAIIEELAETVPTVDGKRSIKPIYFVRASSANVRSWSGAN